MTPLCHVVENGGVSRLLRVALVIALVVVTSAVPRSTLGWGSVVLVGAGDIAFCNSEADEATAALLDGIGGTVFTAGDNAYPDGTEQQFAECYAPSWGRHFTRTRPSPGNHDYKTTDASGYYGYFGLRARPPGGYYAYNRGAWRIYSLNSQRVTDEQLAWLDADLAANPKRCSLAYFHLPRFSSGRSGNSGPMRAFWRPLFKAGAELIIGGHSHHYERFAPMRPNGVKYWKGIRQFVVGTGGAPLRKLSTLKPNSEFQLDTSHGVLELTLHDGSYDWRFITVDGGVADAGSTPCRGKP